MNHRRVIFSIAAVSALLLACSDGNDPVNTPGGKTVSGTMRFTLGGRGSATSLRASIISANNSISTAQRIPDEFIISPLKAEISFSSVTFRAVGGATISTSSLGACVVTYDRSLQSGATLLDCPFTAPVGEIGEIDVAFDKNVKLLVSDPASGIFSNPAVSSGFSKIAPAGGAAYVNYVVTIGGGATRSTPIIFATPITIAENTTPRLYVTTDMIHTLGLRADESGTSLTAKESDPVILFGGLTPGHSSNYSSANTVEGFKLQAGGILTLRVFYDGSNTALFVIGPATCGIEGPKAAWASPPIGSTIGGWLGRDASGTISWALPTTSSYATYSAFYTMQEKSTVGQTTTLNCKASASPPAPADAKTYASGAPAMGAPDKQTTLTLIAK